jgi:hypothetical protein
MVGMTLTAKPIFMSAFFPPLTPQYSSFIPPPFLGVLMLNAFQMRLTVVKAIQTSHVQLDDSNQIRRVRLHVPFPANANKPAELITRESRKEGG